MNVTFSMSLAYLALAFTVVAVLISVKGQSIKIRDSIDHFIADLHRQGRWVMWATIVQAAAVAILIVRALLTGDA